MEQKKNYATKKKGKTECYPFWNLKDIKNVVEWFEEKEDWDGYLITLLELLLGRRIGDTISMKWSDLYYENGREREEVTTIEEQKTGKFTTIPLNGVVFDAVNTYCKKTNTKPMEHYDEYIFEYSEKTRWIERREDKIYDLNDIDAWIKYMGKDFSDERKEKILKAFEKQKDYKTLGGYLYNVVEFMDIVKWHSDSYRKRLIKAATDNGVQNGVSTHSLRKSFGYWIYKIHPYDPDCLISLQRLFNHADIQTTMHYIGLTAEKNRKYVGDLGNLIKDVLDGNETALANNMPVIALKREDFGNIIMQVINNVKSQLPTT